MTYDGDWEFHRVSSTEVEDATDISALRLRKVQGRITCESVLRSERTGTSM